MSKEHYPCDMRKKLSYDQRVITLYTNIHKKLEFRTLPISRKYVYLFLLRTWYYFGRQWRVHWRMWDLFWPILQTCCKDPWGMSQINRLLAGEDFLTACRPVWKFLNRLNLGWMTLIRFSFQNKSSRWRITGSWTIAWERWDFIQKAVKAHVGMIWKSVLWRKLVSALNGEVSFCLSQKYRLLNDFPPGMTSDCILVYQ